MADGKKRPRDAEPTLDADSALAVAKVMEQAKAACRPTLLVVSGADIGRRVSMDRTLLIGRDPDAEVPLTDPLVSWHHARIDDRGDSWTLVDLGSRNGVAVNGEQRVESALEPNSTIALGGTVLRFELQDGFGQHYNETLEKLLNVDDLSGLFVRRKFDAELARMIESARRDGRPLGLLVMDLDGIKGINDEHGHLFGAYAIGESGGVISRVIGSRGIGSRFGGDEFVVALPGLDAVGAADVGEEIRTAIAEHEFVTEGVAISPGISIGVAAFPEDAGDPVSLFRRGDEALYRAKRAGKNRVSR